MITGSSNAISKKKNDNENIDLLINEINELKNKIEGLENKVMELESRPKVMSRDWYTGPTEEDTINSNRGDILTTPDTDFLWIKGFNNWVRYGLTRVTGPITYPT